MISQLSDDISLPSKEAIDWFTSAPAIPASTKNSGVFKELHKEHLLRKWNVRIVQMNGDWFYDIRNFAGDDKTNKSAFLPMDVARVLFEKIGKLPSILTDLNFDFKNN